MTRRLILVLVGLLALTACRLDVVVSVDVAPDGTGAVTLLAVADAELVQRVPGLVDDLRLDDAIANGWVVSEPALDADGSVSITMTHRISSAAELANVLASIGPPLTQVTVARTEVEGRTTNAINGRLVLADGFESFADADLLQAAGGLPFADELGGVSPSEVMSFTYRVALPGELVSSTGTEVDDGVIEWSAPLDGTMIDVATETLQRPASETSSWAGPLSKGAFVALVVWLVVAGGFIAFVIVARGARRRRRSRALRHLGRR